MKIDNLDGARLELPDSLIAKIAYEHLDHCLDLNLLSLGVAPPIIGFDSEGNPEFNNCHPLTMECILFDGELSGEVDFGAFLRVNLAEDILNIFSDEPHEMSGRLLETSAALRKLADDLDALLVDDEADHDNA